MIKIILTGLLAGVIGIIGIEKSISMKKRVVILKNLGESFEYMAELVRLYKPPQMQILKQLMNNERYKILDIYPLMYEYLKKVRNIKLAFDNMIQQSKMGVYLKNEELSILSEFYKNCGNLDYEGYIAKCMSNSLAIKNIEKNAEDEYKDKGKLTASLAVLGGLFLFIVLL